MLAQDLHGDGALTGDHVGVVEGMHEHQAARPSKFERVLVGLVVVVAVQHDFTAEVGHRLHLDVGRGQGHDDDCRNSPGAGRPAPPPGRGCPAEAQMTPRCALIGESCAILL